MLVSATAAARAFYEAVNRGDLDALSLHLAPSFELRLPMDATRVHPVFRGHDGVRSYFAILLRAFDPYRIELRATRQLGATVIVARGRTILLPRGAGEQHVIRFSHFWEFEDDRAVRLYLHEAANPLTMVHSGKAAEQRAKAVA